MHNRAPIVEENFLKSIAEFQKTNICSAYENIFSFYKKSDLIDIFESQIMSRLLDFKSRELRAEGKSFYTIGSSGHETNAALAFVLRPTDMAFLHYRSAAFFIQRSKQLPGSTPIFDMLLSFTASKKDPISGGRHKVIGSKELFIPPQTSTIASHLPKAVGAALSIPRASQLGLQSEMPSDSIVICNFGDASFNHSSALGAINCAQWISYQSIPIPALFVCEDNSMGISVPTPGNWIHDQMISRPGIKYFECDGLDLVKTLHMSKKAADYVRSTKKPAFLHIHTVRLMGHAGSDIETNYLDLKEIEANESKDPLIKSAQFFLSQGFLHKDEVVSIYDNIKDRVDAIALEVKNYEKLKTSEQIAGPLINKKKLKEKPPLPSLEKRRDVFAEDFKQFHKPQTMGKLINWAITDTMLTYDNTLVFGEDVGKKGGVYNISAKLQKRFGKRRVFNSLLDEQSILGTAIGMAHNGFLPIPEIQFLAYVHNAEDQIRGEAATLSYFSNSQFQNPMVIRIAGLGYQKGFGGHFHNDNSIAVFRDIPGLIIACPSNGVDAVKMFRTCIDYANEFGRVVIFLEPIALYNVRDLHEHSDGAWTGIYPGIEEKIALGEFGVEAYRGKKTKLCIISYGNGYYLSCHAAKELETKYKIHVKVIDLRWLAPLNEIELCSEISLSENVLIVDECRKTGSQSEAILSMIMENCEELPHLSRYCADDCIIPLGEASEVVMPSKEGIVFYATDLLMKNDEDFS